MIAIVGQFGEIKRVGEEHFELALNEIDYLNCQLAYKFDAGLV